MKHQEPLGLDGYLLCVARRKAAIDQAEQLAEFALDAEQPRPTTSSAAGGDPARLRGIPVAGHSGAMRGTRPGDDYYPDAHTVLGVTLYTLARDIDPTSPGSDPVEALLDKEAAAATVNGSGHARRGSSLPPAAPQERPQ